MCDVLMTGSSVDSSDGAGRVRSMISIRLLASALFVGGWPLPSGAGR